MIFCQQRLGLCFWCWIWGFLRWSKEKDEERRVEPAKKFKRKIYVGCLTLTTQLYIYNVFFLVRCGISKKELTVGVVTKLLWEMEARVTWVGQ